jgi:hypothetical protein
MSNHKTRRRKQQSSAFEKSQTTIAIVQRYYTSSTMRMVEWRSKQPVLHCNIVRASQHKHFQKEKGKEAYNACEQHDVFV